MTTKRNTRKYYKTLITIEVLSEEPLEDGVSAEDVLAEIDEGGWSGVVQFGDSMPMNGLEAATALLAQGSDPGFFMLDEDGNEVES